MATATPKEAQIKAAAAGSDAFDVKWLSERRGKLSAALCDMPSELIAVIQSYDRPHFVDRYKPFIAAALDFTPATYRDTNEWKAIILPAHTYSFTFGFNQSLPKVYANLKTAVTGTDTIDGVARSLQHYFNESINLQLSSDAPSLIGDMIQRITSPDAVQSVTVMPDRMQCQRHTPIIQTHYAQLLTDMRSHLTSLNKDWNLKILRYAHGRCFFITIDDGVGIAHESLLDATDASERSRVAGVRRVEQ